MARRCLGRSAGRAEPAPEIGTTGENRRNAPNGLLRRAGETKERRIVGGVRRTTGGWQAVVESSRRFDYDDSSRLPPFLVVQFAGCVPPRLTCAAVYPPSGARRSVSSTSSTSVVSGTSTLFDFCALVRGSTNFWGRFRRRVRAASVQPFFFFCHSTFRWVASRISGSRCFFPSDEFSAAAGRGSIASETPP